MATHCVLRVASLGATAAAFARCGTPFTCDDLMILHSRLLDAAHQQLGGLLVVVWDNLKCATRRYGIEQR